MALKVPVHNCLGCSTAWSRVSCSQMSMGTAVGSERQEHTGLAARAGIASGLKAALVQAPAVGDRQSLPLT